MLKNNHLVLDVGEAVIKYGYAGEHLPRIVSLEHNQLHIILQSLESDSILLCEDILWSTAHKTELLQLLSNYFKSVNTFPSCLLSILTTGMPHGLVIDVGHSETKLIPVYDYRILLHSIKTIGIGGKSLNHALKLALSKTSSKQLLDSLTFQDYENIKSKLLLIRNGNDGIISMGEEPIINISIKNINLSISRIDADMISESLFGVDEDGESIMTLAHSLIKTSPIDIRMELCRNICITGGVASILGFKNRLMEEMRQKFIADNQMTKLGNCLRENGVFHPNITAWIGGSLLIKSDMLPKELS